MGLDTSITEFRIIVYLSINLVDNDLVIHYLTYLVNFTVLLRELNDV